MPNNHTFGRLAAALERSRDALIPPAFQFLWRLARFIVAYGGRSSGKSWSIVRVLLILGKEQKHLILCARESQSSIKESAYRLLCDQIRALDLEDFYTIGADKITGRNGTEIIFEGLFRNAERLKSYEGISIVWVEEAHRVSERSWEDLIPTVRKAGSRFFISFNPSQVDDPVWQRFVASQRPDVIAQRVSWRDNPFFGAEMTAEKDWCEATDHDQYRHIWEGEFRTVTEAQIFRGKYVSQMFDVDPHWSGPHYGLDFGFSQDPTAGTVSYIDDNERVLYIAREYWRLGADIDRLPSDLEAALPGVSTHTVYCDSARPESISYLTRYGIPGARSAEKWSGSVDDGVSFLRAFSKIVIHSSCVHTLDEANRYSFKVDRLTGNPLPEVEDKHNHIWDSVRYALSPLIRNKGSHGYFSRSALLVRGEPVEVLKIGRPLCVFMTVAICDQPGTGVGVVFWSGSPQFGWPLIVLDYDLVEIEEVNEEWFAKVFARARELHSEWNPMTFGTAMWADEPLFSSLGDTFKSYLRRDWGHLIFSHKLRPPIDLKRTGDAMLSYEACIPISDIVKFEPRLDARAERIRSNVNGGRYVKLAHSAYTRQVPFRSITSNALLAQLLSYRPGQTDTAQELVSAFVDGLRLTQFSPSNSPVESRVAAPRGGFIPADIPSLSPVSSRPVRVPGVPLMPGEHNINGQRVLVQPSGQAGPADGSVHYPLSPGRHYIDGKVVNVQNPAAAITILAGRRS